MKDHWLPRLIRWTSANAFSASAEGSRASLSSHGASAAQIVSCSPRRQHVVPVASSTIFIKHPGGPRSSNHAWKLSSPSAGISLASRDSNCCQRCDAAALWLLPHGSAATASSPADSSPPASLLRLPASASGPSLAPKPLPVAIPSCSSLSSSIRPPQEVVV